jgi:hypothetical protein
MTPTVQWKGDNAQEVEQLLQGHLARADQVGDHLLIRGLGIHLELSLGDSLMLDGDRLGVRRSAGAAPLQESSVTWKGDNVKEIARFMTDYQVEYLVMGECLHIIAAQETVVLGRGDRLVKRDGQIVVSIAGKQHRYG